MSRTDALTALLRRPAIRFWLLYLIVLACLLFFGDRVGWEGDDVSQLEGITNFQYKGAGGVYQYHWQPLAYQLNILIYRLARTPRVLFFVPQVVGAANITLLAWSAFLFGQGKIRLSLVIAFLILVPELFFCALYYNSTVFAMLPLSVAFALLFREPSTRPSEPLRYVTIGFVSALAVLFRIEFLLSLPLLWYLVVFVKRPGARLVLLALSASIVVAIVGLASGALDVPKIFHTATTYGVDVFATHFMSAAMSARISFSSMNVTVWIALAVYTVYFLVSRINRKQWRSLLVLLPIAVLLVPFTRPIPSPKFLMPIIVFVPIALSQMALELREHVGDTAFGRASRALVALAVLLQVVSVEPCAAFPFVRVTTQPTFIGDTDGTRPLGAYLRGYDRVRRPVTEGRFDGGGVRFGSELADVIASCSRNVTLVYLNKEDNQAIDSWWWPWPAFYLQLKGYRIVEYLDQNEIVVGRGEQTVKLKIVDEAAFRDYVTDDVLVRLYVTYDESYEDRTEAALEDVRRACGAD